MWVVAIADRAVWARSRYAASLAYNRLLTDSRAVALAFGKRHWIVLRAIEAKLNSSRPRIVEHAQHNFVLSAYTDTSGRTLPMYLLTAIGLTELTMGFSGEDACEVRIRFVNAFEAVANRLAEHERSITERLREYDRRSLPSAEKGSDSRVRQFFSVRSRPRPSSPTQPADRSGIERSSGSLLEQVASRRADSVTSAGSIDRCGAARFELSRPTSAQQWRS